MKQDTDPIDLQMLEQMLVFISADQAREDWAKLLMAAKSEFGEAAKEAMKAWSATAANYDYQSFNSTWKSIKAGGGITIRTLVHEAKQNGFEFAPMSKEVKRRLLKSQKERAAKRKEEEVKYAKEKPLMHAQAKRKANHFISRAFRANFNHPYFVEKGICELLNGLNVPLQLGASLLVPLYQFKTPSKAHPSCLEWQDMFELVSVQFINADGSKRFLKGTNKVGSFFVVRLPELARSIVVCEGVATGLTYAGHYDLASAVIIAFDAGNLKPVARAFKLRYPASRLIIAADNDRFNKDGTPSRINKGLVSAEKAGKAVDGGIVYPEFSAHESGSDWNDRYLLDRLDVNPQRWAYE